MRRWIVVVALALAGCGDNRSQVVADARAQIDGGVDPDAPVEGDFTGFVRDQILNHTDDATAPVPYGVFAILTDNDLDDDTFQAYADLFQ